MKFDRELLAGAGATILSATGTAMQTEEILRIVSLIITILGAIISMIVLPILAWYKNAKKDGKIDIGEVAEGAKTLNDGLKGVKDALKDKGKGDE